MTRRTFIVISIAVFLLFHGCSEKDDREKEEYVESHFKEQVDDRHLGQEQVFLDEVLELWEQGETERAVEQFLQTEWDNTIMFSDRSRVGITDDEWMSLPSESKKQEIEAECLRYVRLISKLVKHVSALGHDKITVKDYDGAQEMFDAILRCSEALSKAKAGTVITRLGQSVKRVVLKDLLQLYSQTNNDVKLKATQRSLEEL